MAALSGSLPIGPRGRALALLVTAGGLLILWLGVVSPLVEWYDANAEALAQRRALAGRMQDLADALPDLRRQVEASQPKDAPAAALLEGGSDAVAAATLQGLLETMCAGAGAKVTSAEALPAEQAGAYRRIGLRVSLDAGWTQLTRLLRAVQKATPRMFVDDLQLHAQPTNEKVRELPLDISLTLLAFRLPGAPPTPPTPPQSPAADAASQPPPDAPLDASPPPEPPPAPPEAASPDAPSPPAGADPGSAQPATPQPDPGPSATAPTTSP